MGEPPESPHVLVEVLPSGSVHLLESLHHDCRAIGEDGLVGGSKAATAEYLGGCFQ